MSGVFSWLDATSNWRYLDPTKIWVAASPIVVLAAMGSPGFMCAAPVFFGVYLCLVHPFRSERERGWLSFLGKPVILGLIALVVVANFVQLVAASAKSHKLFADRKFEDASDAVRTLMRAILADARQKKPRSD